MRQARGLTQQDLAALTGLQRGNISHYERNKVKPAAETIVQLASYFNVSSDWLLTGREQIKADGEDPQLAVRLKQLRSRLQTTQEEFAVRCGATPDEVGDWEAGRAYPSAAAMAKLAATFGISLDWLITGVSADNQLPAPNEDADLQLISEFLAYRRRREQTHCLSIDGAGAVAGGVVREAGVTYLPLFSRHQAHALLPDVAFDGFVAVEGRLAGARSFVVQVHGEGLSGLGIEPGDLAVVQYLTPPSPTGMALVRWGDRTLIAQVEAAGDGIRLLTAERLHVPPPDDQPVVLGRVIQVLKPGHWQMAGPTKEE